jgi:hypothetical protein
MSVGHPDASVWCRKLFSGTLERKFHHCGSAFCCQKIRLSFVSLFCTPQVLHQILRGQQLQQRLRLSLKKRPMSPPLQRSAEFDASTVGRDFHGLTRDGPCQRQCPLCQVSGQQVKIAKDRRGQHQSITGGSRKFQQQLLEAQKRKNHASHSLHIPNAKHCGLKKLGRPTK